jgi:hypothetical protein
MFKSWTSDTSRPVLDVVNMIAGIALLLSPWYLAFAAESTAAWSAWVAGAVITLLAVGAVIAFHAYEEWANLVIGAWTVIAPWVLGSAAVSSALWIHVIVGAVVAVLAAGGLWIENNRPMSTA